MSWLYTFKCATCGKQFSRQLAMNGQPQGDMGRCWQWQRERGPVVNLRDTGCTGAVRWNWQQPQPVAVPAVVNPHVQLALQDAAAKWFAALDPINTTVRAWRAANPTIKAINAGSNGVIGSCAGGNEDQLALTIPAMCKQLGVSGIHIAEACASSHPNWSFDGFSATGTYKFRVKHAGWQDVMIHVKFQ
jgi:hypothetical protein